MRAETINPLGMCFGMMKVKYQIYNNILADIGYIEATDKLNVFINLETAMRYESSALRCQCPASMRSLPHGEPQGT